jgi:hypothetical protein
MELALIPPTPLLLLNDAQRYQLMLPHMLKDQEYASAYWDYCQNNDKYVILDNGAAEQSPYETKALLAIAKQFMVDEMVVPDVMGDWNETVTAASLFAREWLNYWQRGLGNKPWKLGFVAQGKTAEEAIMCAISMYTHPLVGKLMDVVYVPRLLLSVNNHTARLRVAQHLHNFFRAQGVPMDIHFLGASTVWPAEVLHAADSGYVRSLDTSMPFVFSQKPFLGRVDNRDTWAQIPHRGSDSDYWTRTWDDEELDLVRHNVATLRGWAQTSPSRV